MNNKQGAPLVVIVGPTASGKTGLSIELAKRYNGEIISADSRAVYTGMDIGAAKPTITERQAVPHWGFDIVSPNQRFTAAEFKSYAQQKIAEIRECGRVPFLVGGTGLYVDSVIFDYDFPPEPDHNARSKWEQQSLEELHEYCVKNNITLPENSMNKRYVINAILRNGYALKRKSKPLLNTVVVGISTDRNELRQRIEERTDGFFASGVLDEAEQLAATYGWDSEAMTGNIYPLARRYFAGEISLTDMKQLFNYKEWHLAKRQLTWLKRNEHIAWFTRDAAYTHLTQVLENLNNS